MEIRPTPREKVLQASRDLYRKEYGDRTERRVVYRNVRPVLGMSGASHVLSAGRIWEVPPVPWRRGVELMEIKQGLDRISRQEDEAREVGEEPDPVLLKLYGDLVERFVDLAPSLVLPAQKGPARWLWKLGLRRNPFRDASEQELGELLAFFCGCRTRSPGRHPRQAAGTPKSISSTGSTSSGRSSGGTRGRGRTGSTGSPTSLGPAPGRN